MPSLWRWPLAGGVAPDRRALHGLLSRWLDEDHHAARKAWSWTASSTGSGDQLVEIGLVDDTLAKRLVDNADLYRRRGRAVAGLAVTAAVEQVAAVSWPQLVARSSATQWTVDFVSPVTFRRGNRFLPWPAPSAVLGSLRAAWRSFGAPHVGDLTVDLSLDPVVVTAISGASQVERVDVHQGPNLAGNRELVGIAVGGFVGRVSYAVDGAVDPAAVDSLIRLAPFAGIGSYTTRGFGAVRPRTPSH